MIIKFIYHILADVQSVDILAVTLRIGIETKIVSEVEGEIAIVREGQNRRIYGR